MQHGGIYFPGMEMFLGPLLEKTGLSPVGAVINPMKNWARGEIKTNIGNHTSSYIIILMEFMLRDKLIPLLTSPGDAGVAGDAGGAGSADDAGSAGSAGSAGAHPTLSEAAVKIDHFYEKAMILELIKGITGFDEQKRIFLGALSSSPVPRNAENDFPAATESATTKEKLYEVERDYVRTLSKGAADTGRREISGLQIAYNNLLNDMINSYLTPFGNRGLPHLINGMMFGENVFAVVEQSLDAVYKAYTSKGVGDAPGQGVLGMRLSKRQSEQLESDREELFQKIEQYLEEGWDVMKWKDVGAALQLGDIISKSGGEYHDGEWTEEAIKQLLAYIEEVDKTITKNLKKDKIISRSTAVSEVLLVGGDHVASSEYVQRVDELLSARASEDSRRSTASEDSRRSSGSWGSGSSVSVLDAPAAAAPAAAAAPPATVCPRCDILVESGFQGEAAVCGLCQLEAQRLAQVASGAQTRPILGKMDKERSLSAGVHWRTEGEQSDRAQVAGLPIGHQPPRAMTPPASGGSTTPRSAEGGTEGNSLDTALEPTALTAGGMRYHQTKNKKLKTKKSKNKKPKTRKSKKLRFKKLRSKKRTTKKRQSKNKRY